MYFLHGAKATLITAISFFYFVFSAYLNSNCLISEFHMDNVHDLFSVHVANVPFNITDERISNLFAAAGDVKNVFIASVTPGGNYTYTYAFVRYKTLAEARKACTLLNNSPVNGVLLRVSLSDSSRKKLNGHQNKEEKSISRDPHPRMESNKYTVSHAEEKALHKQIKKSLNCLNNKDSFAKWLGVTDESKKNDFLADLKDIIVDMAHVPTAVGIDPIKFTEKPVDKSTLKDLILRYHEKNEPKNMFKKIDLDLTEHTKLSHEESEQYFPSCPYRKTSSDLLDKSISISTYDEFCKMNH